MVNTCLNSAEEPFKAPLDGKHFYPFLQFSFGRLTSVDVFLRILEVYLNFFCEKIALQALSLSSK